MGKRRVFHVHGAIPVLLLFILLLSVSCSAQSSTASSDSSPAPTPATCGSWTIVHGPTPGNYSNSLNSVAAASGSTIWTVGSYENASGSQQTLTEYWNGNVWKVIKSPNPISTINAQLSGVAALSKNNAWAVGSYHDTSNAIHSLIEHWNGSSWSIVSSPTPNGSADQLYSVTIISASNVWAVGSYSDSLLVEHTLVEHWNGSLWSIVSIPEPKGSTQNHLLSITAISANNVWAVGSYSYRAKGSHIETLTEHWNGSSWSVVSSPNTQSSGNILEGVTALSNSNIWAVGTSFVQSGSPTRTLIEHWNGSDWSIVSSPNVASAPGDDLLGIAALSENNIWAVGRWDAGSRNYRTLIEHWNGRQWSLASTSIGTSTPDELLAITRVPGSKAVWAVGFHFSNTLSEPLIGSNCTR